MSVSVKEVIKTEILASMVALINRRVELRAMLTGNAMWGKVERGNRVENGKCMLEFS